MTLLTVRVPASTSNLGPGFDCLGLALSLFLEVEVEPSESAEIEVVGPAADDWPRGDADLLTRAYALGAQRLGLPAEACFRVHTEIPVGRGFGSSGSAVAAGLLLANALSADPLGARELHRLGVELEGHPDNVTASLFGGCTLCHPAASAEGPEWIPIPVHADVGFALAWSSESLSTAAARAALPVTVAHQDAVENARRLPLLLEGLREADPHLIAVGGVDALHERYRLPLIRGAPAALREARRAGAWLATISGAGSGLVALGPLETIADVAAAMERELERDPGGGRARVVTPVTGVPEAHA